MSEAEATQGEPDDRSLEELAEDVANNEAFSEPVREMGRIVRESARERGV